MLKLSGVALILVATSCAHQMDGKSGRDVASRVASARQVVQGIVLCRTTEAELRNALGAPTRDGIIHRQRIVSWIVSDQGAVKYLAVAVNGAGIVTDLYWDVPTEIPWVPADSCSSPV